METVYLSLGSNIEPRRNISIAIQELRRYFGQLQLSPVYESNAIGFSGAPFINLVVSFTTNLSPDYIQKLIHHLENSQGRIRNGERFTARTLDIDLILYGSLINSTPPILPRDDILRYAFVLRPLADIAPDVIHPLLGISYRELWKSFDATDQPLALINFDDLV